MNASSLVSSHYIYTITTWKRTPLQTTALRGGLIDSDERRKRSHEEHLGFSMEGLSLKYSCFT